jgi:alpha-L-fucosidase
MAWGKWPVMLVDDRTVYNEFENYRTAEQKNTETIPPYPWENCIALGQHCYPILDGERFKLAI